MPLEEIMNNPLCVKCLLAQSAANFCIHADPPTIAAITVNGTAEAVVYALSGTMSEFACIVSGTSPLSTTWDLQTTRGGSNRFDTEFNSILTQADEGNYTCTVVNIDEGLSDSATVIIKVFGEGSYTQLT